MHLEVLTKEASVQEITAMKAYPKQQNRGFNECLSP